MRIGRPILALLALLGACETETLEVESTTQWSGVYGIDAASQSVDGSGNRTFHFSGGSGTLCWTFQKLTTGGSLRAYAVKHSITGSDRRGDATTTAQFGIVSGCDE